MVKSVRLPGTISMRAHCVRCGIEQIASTKRRAKQMLREHYLSKRCDDNINMSCEYDFPERDYRYCNKHRSWAYVLNEQCKKKVVEGLKGN